MSVNDTLLKKELFMYRRNTNQMKMFWYWCI